MCSSLCLSPKRDVWPPKCRKALPVVAPFPCKMNSLASAPDVQLVLTQLRMLAGINHFDANILAVFTMDSERNNMQDVKSCWVTSCISLSPRFLPIPAPEGAGKGLRCGSIVTLEDTWNYWWILERSQSEKNGTKHSVAQIERQQWQKWLVEIWFVLVYPVIYKPITSAVWGPLQCDKWSFIVGLLLALSCNQSRIVFLVSLSLSTWTVTVLGVNSNHSLLLFMSYNGAWFLCTECDTVRSCSATVNNVTFIYMFVCFFLYSSVCNLVSMPQVLKKVWRLGLCVYNCKVMFKEAKNPPPKTELVFDKLVKEQKQKSFCFIRVLFFLLLLKQKKKKSWALQSNCCPPFEKIGARQSMKVIASERSNHIYPVLQLKVSLAFKLPNKIVINRNQWEHQGSAQTLHTVFQKRGRGRVSAL